MTKKIIFSGLLFFIMSSMVCYAGSKYGDAVKVNNEFFAIMEKFISALDKADNGGSVAKAMNGFAEGIDKITPKMKKVMEAHPELKDHTTMPEELKALQKKGEAIQKKFSHSFMKAMQYAQDAEVKKAQERIGDAMRAMQLK